MRTAILFALCLLLMVLVPLPAQNVTVDYPDSIIKSPPQGQYPLYTPRSGTTVRAQIYCPPTFAGLPKTAGLVTRVGFQIAGKLPYTTFVGRAGSTKVGTLTNTFATNLPNQSIQFDLSGQNLPGGGSGKTATTQVNIWVEFDLRHPFVWNPGEGLIVDVISKSKVPDEYCRSAIGTGVARMLNTSYTPTTTTGSTVASGGIKLRFVFSPLYQVVPFGTGCAGTGGLVPALAGSGSTKIGSAGLLVLLLTKARPLANSVFVLGIGGSETALPGGCMIYTPLHVLVLGQTDSAGSAKFPLIIPNNPSLSGVSASTQYAIDDPNTKAAPLPFTVSNGVRIVPLN